MAGSKVSRAGRLTLAVCLVLLFSNVGLAAVVTDFRVIRESDGAVWTRNEPLAGEGPKYSWTYDVNATNNTSGWDFDWSIEADVDPVVSSNFTISNPTAVPQSFTVIALTPVIPSIPGGTLTGGTVGGSLTDNNGGGASITSVALYTASIDGIDYQLLGDPLAESAGNFSNKVFSDEFGQPIPNQSGPAAMTTIGIKLQFTLGAGDSIALTSNFIVDPVPEPGSLAVLGLGVVGLMARRRAR